MHKNTYGITLEYNELIILTGILVINLMSTRAYHKIELEHQMMYD